MDLILDYGEENEVSTVGELKRQFYRFHRRKRETLNPIVLKLNPPQFFSELDDKWFAVYYRKFFVTITEGKSMFGPHVAQLSIQIYPGRSEWLGTCQLKYNFFSKKELRKKLRLAITKQKYFCSEKSAQKIIEFTQPNEKSSLTIRI